MEQGREAWNWPFGRVNQRISNPPYLRSGMPFGTSRTAESFGIPLENWVPLIPKLRDGEVPQTDRYRTASGRFRAGLFEFGFFLHTGEGSEVDWIDIDGDGILDTRAVIDGNIGEPKRSNGMIYLGFGGLNFGWDSEGIRHTLQNRVAHDQMSRKPQNGRNYPWMPVLDRRPRFILQFGGF